MCSHFNLGSNVRPSTNVEDCQVMNWLLISDATIVQMIHYVNIKSVSY